jgi:copper chaperone CopZ
MIMISNRSCPLLYSRNILLYSFLLLFIFFVVSACGDSSQETATSEPIITEASIPVQGMTCGSCEHHIETEVIRKDGVVEIKADHEKAMAFVKYDSSKVSLDQLVAAINETGYKASKPVSSDQ